MNEDFFFREYGGCKKKAPIRFGDEMLLPDFGADGRFSSNTGIHLPVFFVSNSKAYPIEVIAGKS
jgi:hypothetical protein